jgi:poly-gamma-glutamate synthesis protein (capsule biosynthesis protein)
VHARLPQALIALALGVGCASPQNEAAPPDPGPSDAAPEPAPEPVPAPAPASAPASAPAPAPRAESLELVFVGDVIFGRYREAGFDPIATPGADPFTEIAPLLRADIAVANLETPVIEQLPETSPIGSKYRFGASRAMLADLARAGVHVVSLANNHYFDLREEGQRETPRIAAELGLLPIGASRADGPLWRVESLERSGWKVGFLAVTTRRNAPDRDGAPELPYLELLDMPAELGPLLRAARDEHDVLVVYVHWGDEYAEAPDVWHRRTARALIDAGADLVVGHHPHVLQGVERHGRGVIAYSMGNFLFENTNEIPRQTGVLRARFRGGPACLEEVRFHPAYIDRTPFKHPAPATGALARKIRDRMLAKARALDTALEPVEGGEDLRLAGGCPAPGRRASSR